MQHNAHAARSFAAAWRNSILENRYLTSRFFAAAGTAIPAAGTKSAREETPSFGSQIVNCASLAITAAAGCELVTLLFCRFLAVCAPRHSARSHFL